MDNNACVTRYWDDIVKHCNQTHGIDAILSEKVDERIILQAEKEQVIDDLLKGFGNIFRKDGSYYVEHLEATLNNCLGATDNICRTLILAALLHDSIEDAGESYESIGGKYGAEVAICVATLSKKPFWKYIDTESEDFREFNALSGEINKGGIEVHHDFQIGHHHEISEEIQVRWRVLESKYKKIRDDQYYGRFASLEALKAFIRSEQFISMFPLGEEDQSVLQDEEIVERLARIIALVKLCDRLHNLRTLPENDTNKEKQYISTHALKKLWQEIGGNIEIAITKELTGIVHGFNKKVRARVDQALANTTG